MTKFPFFLGPPSYTLLGFTWDAMLKHTSVRFELLIDIDMVMFERGIRDGLSQCSGRYAQANNKYMCSFDPSKPSSYLIYDVNNLYGWAMCQPLHIFTYAEFRWVEDAANFDVREIAPDSPTGYILEINLEYSQHLHDRHTDLLFCPTRDKPLGKCENKLLAMLYDKQRYVIHYRNLQQCTRHSLRVIKIHLVLQFAQSPWLRHYIELSTQFITRAKNDFEKNLYKLMYKIKQRGIRQNYGECAQHVDVKLITKWDTAIRRGSKFETEFPQPQRLCRKFDRRRNAQIRGEVQQTDLRRYVNTRYIENLLVQILPRVHVTDVSRHM